MPGSCTSQILTPLISHASLECSTEQTIKTEGRIEFTNDTTRWSHTATFCFISHLEKPLTIAGAKFYYSTSFSALIELAGCHEWHPPYKSSNQCSKILLWRPLVIWPDAICGITSRLNKAWKHQQWQQQQQHLITPKTVNNEKSAQRWRKHCALAVARWSQKILHHRRPPSRRRRTAKL